MRDDINMQPPLGCNMLNVCDKHCHWSGDGIEHNLVGLPARVRIPVLPGATSRLLHELLVGVSFGFLVGSRFRMTGTLLHLAGA
jgi:hypothetical protein